MMDIKEVLLLQFINFLIKSLKVVVFLCFKMNNQQNNCRNQLLENLKKEPYIHHLKTIFGGADLADGQLISKFNKGIRFLLWVIDIYSKYAWVVSLYD